MSNPRDHRCSDSIRTLAVALVLVVVVSATGMSWATGPRRVDGYTLVESVDDGGACTGIVDVGVRGCLASRAVYVDDEGEAGTLTTGCGHTFELCGEPLMCDCTAAWSDAGLLLPDGGLCRFSIVRQRDGGFAVRNPCGAHFDVHGAGGIVSPAPLSPAGQPLR